MISNELIEYIKAQQAAGLDRERITALLLGNSWEPADIEEAFKVISVGTPTHSFVPPVITPVSVQIASNTQSLPTQPVAQVEQMLQSVPKEGHGLVWAIVLFIILVAAGGVYFFFRSTDGAPVSVQDTSSEKPAVKYVVQKQDTKPLFTRVNVSENAAHDFDIFEKKVYAKEDNDFFSKYTTQISSTNTPTYTQAHTVVTKYPDMLKQLDVVLSKKYYQCSVAMGDSCLFNTALKVSDVAVTEGFERLAKSDKAGAIESGNKVVSLGKLITSSSDDVLNFLVGWQIQRKGYQFLGVAGSKLARVEKDALIEDLRIKHKSALSLWEARQIEMIDYITSSTTKPTLMVVDKNSEEAVEDYRKAANATTWGPERTKIFFRQSFELARKNVDALCTGTTTSSVINIYFNPTGTSTTDRDNFVGKTLYTTTYQGFDSLNLKRCEVEAAVEAL